jgi:hypothetical protein
MKICDFHCKSHQSIRSENVIKLQRIIYDIKKTVLSLKPPKSQYDRWVAIVNKLDKNQVAQKHVNNENTNHGDASNNEAVVAVSSTPIQSEEIANTSKSIVNSNGMDVIETKQPLETIPTDWKKVSEKFVTLFRTNITPKVLSYTY